MFIELEPQNINMAVLRETIKKESENKITSYTTKNKQNYWWDESIEEKIQGKREIC